MSRCHDIIYDSQPVYDVYGEEEWYFWFGFDRCVYDETTGGAGNVASVQICFQQVICTENKEAFVSFTSSLSSSQVAWKEYQKKLVQIFFDMNAKERQNNDPGPFISSPAIDVLIKKNLDEDLIKVNAKEAYSLFLIGILNNHCFDNYGDEEVSNEDFLWVTQALNVVVTQEMSTIQDANPEYYTAKETSTSSDTMERAMSILLIIPVLNKVRIKVHNVLGCDLLVNATFLFLPQESSKESKVRDYHIPHGTMLLVNMGALPNDLIAWICPHILKLHGFKVKDNIAKVKEVIKKMVSQCFTSKIQGDVPYNPGEYGSTRVPSWRKTRGRVLFYEGENDAVAFRLGLDQTRYPHGIIYNHEEPSKVTFFISNSSDS